MEWIAIIISCFFALNIGASGAAASMGVAYGSKAINRNIHALFICAIAIYLGATIGGGEVIRTIGEGLIDPQFLTIKIVIVILLSATMSLFIANLLGIPPIDK
ncbi:inorganic phosphate transporter [Bacillus carboniphilus]|uniref:Inorganic phosphate transporter n=1 Tax=Bacillus carboniphilus TaxID=86663 RepID=A0ABY9JZ29_9BACI|nr:inorganic phosphate transporter [Bacillus carboniphilus]WLR43593.1 inorganic phosphate transporter [Bacillus carboniphilus]